MKLDWKKFSVAAGIGAVLLLTTALVVFSQQPPGPPRPPMGPRGGFGHGPHGPGGPGGFGPLAGLNLTDAQKEAIRKIHESFAENTRALHDQMRALDESKSDPMSGDFNEAAARSAAEARAKIQVELEVSHAKMMSEVAGVLTAEQKAELATRHQQMRRMGPPPPPPAPPAPGELQQLW